MRPAAELHVCVYIQDSRLLKNIPYAYTDSTYVQERPAQKCGSFGHPAENATKTLRRSRVTAPADLESPKGFGFGLGLGSGWSGPTCKVEIDDISPAQSFVQAAPAQSGSREHNAVYKNMQ